MSESFYPVSHWAAVSTIWPRSQATQFLLRGFFPRVFLSQHALVCELLTLAISTEEVSLIMLDIPRNRPVLEILFQICLLYTSDAADE